MTSRARCTIPVALATSGVFVAGEIWCFCCAGVFVALVFSLLATCGVFVAGDVVFSLRAGEIRCFCCAGVFVAGKIWCFRCGGDLVALAISGVFVAGEIWCFRGAGEIWCFRLNEFSPVKGETKISSTTDPSDWNGINKNRHTSPFPAPLVNNQRLEVADK